MSHLRVFLGRRRALLFLEEDDGGRLAPPVGLVYPCPRVDICCCCYGSCWRRLLVLPLLLLLLLLKRKKEVRAIANERRGSRRAQLTSGHWS